MSANPKSYLDRESVTRAAIRYAAQGLAAASDSHAFDELVRNLAHALRASYALIGTLDRNGEEDMVDVIAMYNEGELEEPFRYHLKGSPCEDLVNQTFRYVPEKVGQQYEEVLIKNIQADGFAGIPLYATDGHVIGLMVAMSKGPMTDSVLVEQLLRIFSVRAALELERRFSQRHAEETLDQYRAIFNASVDGMILFDDQGNVVEANPAFKRMHGYSVDRDFRGIDPFRFIPPHRRERFHWFADMVVREGHFHIEGLAQRPDGTVFDVDLHGVRLIRDDKPHMLAIVRDITEQKQARMLLEEREEQYRVMFNATSDGMALWTRDGRLVDVNEACCALHGMTREELLVAELSEFVPPESMPKLQRLLETVGRGESFQDEAIATHKDGRVFYLDMRGEPAQFQGQPHILLILRDISEQKEVEADRSQLEAQLRQAQKMEAIGHLTGGIAHDFNNLLTGMSGYIIMAQEWEQQRPDERLHHYLKRAEHSSSRARDLIQQMLLFSRGGRGEAKPVYLEQQVREGIQLLESMLPSSIEISFRAEEHLSQVTADPVHLEQVLVNLCINARDAMNGAGHLQIDLRHEHCGKPCTCASCKKPMQGDYQVLSVTDTGAGIDAEMVDRIFEPFYSTKQVGKGSGMGLSTVHGIVHEYGGHILVRSEPGKGSQFCVMLPLPLAVANVGQADTAVEVRSSPTAHLSGRVLLVEDDAEVRDYMIDRLTDWGLYVEAYANGPDMLKQLSSISTPDLYLFDYTMPGMNGIELARTLHESNPGARIVLYTGYGEELTDRDIADAGILALLRKPIDIPSFHNLLGEYLPHS